MNKSRVSVKQKLRKKLILKTLIEAGTPVSIAQVTKSISSNYPTVSTLLTQLRDEGLVIELGPGESTGGRRPILYRVNKEKILFAGVEVGHINSMLLVVNIENEIILKGKIESKSILSSKNPLKVLAENVIEYLEEKLEDININMRNLQGVGFGFAGDIVRYFSGSNENSYLLFRTLEHRLSKYMNFPVLIENDAKLNTRAEKWFGKLKNTKNALCISLTWGIGLGIIMGGEFQGGNHGNIEFGHITVKEDGDLCYCGKRGCLETLASGHALVQKAKKRIIAGEKTMLKQIIGSDVEKLNEEILVNSALDGDIFSIELIIEAAKILGLQIANLIKLFDPEKVVINGTLSRAGRLLLNQVKTEVDKRALYYTQESIPIETSDLGEKAIALGAASLHIQGYLDIAGTDVEKFV